MSGVVFMREYWCAHYHYCSQGSGTVVYSKVHLHAQCMCLLIFSFFVFSFTSFRGFPSHYTNLDVSVSLLRTFSFASVFFPYICPE